MSCKLFKNPTGIGGFGVCVFVFVGVVVGVGVGACVFVGIGEFTVRFMLIEGEIFFFGDEILLPFIVFVCILVGVFGELILRGMRRIGE